MPNVPVIKTNTCSCKLFVRKINTQLILSYILFNVKINLCKFPSSVVGVFNCIKINPWEVLEAIKFVD